MPLVKVVCGCVINLILLDHSYASEKWDTTSPIKIQIMTSWYRDSFKNTASTSYTKLNIILALAVLGRSHLGLPN